MLFSFMRKNARKWVQLPRRLIRLCNNIGITFIQKYANTVTPIVLAVFTSFPNRIFTEKKVEKRFLWLRTLTQMATPNISIKKNGTKIPGMMKCLPKIFK